MKNEPNAEYTRYPGFEFNVHGCFWLSNTSGQSFHPISGGELITNDRIHTPPINISTRSTVLFCAYRIGSVIALYRSSAIAHKFKIDDVQHSTSLVSHILHKCIPNIHRPIIMLATLNGSTSIATVKSATASETIKKFCTIRSGLYVNTLNMTNTFPIIVRMMINERIIVIKTACHCGTAKSIPIIDGYRIFSGVGHTSCSDLLIANVVAVAMLASAIISVSFHISNDSLLTTAY